MRMQAGYTFALAVRLLILAAATVEADIYCYACNSYMPQCASRVDNSRGTVFRSRCSGHCFARVGEDNAVYRGCTDGFADVPTLSHAYVGCRNQTWNNRNLLWCLCNTTLCNGAPLDLMGRRDRQPTPAIQRQPDRHHTSGRRPAMIQDSTSTFDAARNARSVDRGGREAAESAVRVVRPAQWPIEPIFYNGGILESGKYIWNPDDRPPHIIETEIDEPQTRQSAVEHADQRRPLPVDAGTSEQNVDDANWPKFYRVVSDDPPSTDGPDRQRGTGVDRALPVGLARLPSDAESSPVDAAENFRSYGGGLATGNGFEIVFVEKDVMVNGEGGAVEATGYGDVDRTDGRYDLEPDKATPCDNDDASLFQRHPGDCRLYVACVTDPRGQRFAIPSACPSGLFWDDRRKLCAVPDSTSSPCPSQDRGTRPAFEVHGGRRLTLQA